MPKPSAGVPLRYQASMPLRIQLLELLKGRLELGHILHLKKIQDVREECKYVKSESDATIVKALQKGVAKLEVLIASSKREKARG